MSDTDSGTAPPAPSRRLVAGLSERHRLPALMWVVALVLLALDQVTKAWALSALAGVERQPLLGSVLGLRLVLNPGAALSLATGQTWLLTAVACVVVVAVVWVSRRLGSTGWALVLGLVLGGASGNLVDRLVRPPSVGQGHVVDFIDYGVFVGNVADIAIVAAAAMIVWLSLTGRELGGATAPQQEGETASQTDEADSQPDGDGDQALAATGGCQDGKQEA